MVAARGRFTALWFVALMVSAAFVGITPTAAAAITITAAEIRYQDNSAIPSTSYVKTGDLLEVHIEGTAAGETGCLNPVFTAWVTTINKLTLVNATETLAVSGGGFNQDIEFTVQSAGYESATPFADFDVEIIGACTGNAGNPARQVRDVAPAIKIDTAGPALTLTPSWADGPDVGDNAAVRGIGDILTFTATVGSDINGVESGSLARTSPILDGQSNVALTSGAPVSLTVAAGSRNGGGSTPVVTVKVRDQLGNERTETISADVDNVLPPAHAVAPSTWEREVDRNVLDFRLGTPPADATQYALYQRNAASGAYTLVKTGASAANPADHEFTLPNNLDTPVFFQIASIDAAGNLGPAVDLAMPVANFSYGRNGDSPSTVDCKSAGHVCVGGIYVTVLANGPAGTQLYDCTQTGCGPGTSQDDDHQDPNLFLNLSRTNGTFAHWIQGASGGDLDGDFFRGAAILNPRPGGNLPSATNPTNAILPERNLTTTAIKDLLFTNLTHATGRARTLLDGDYYLELTVRNPDTVEHTTRMARRFAVDGVGPTFATASTSYTGTPWSPPDWLGQNMSSVHGTDGNPVQVYINTSEMRTTWDTDESNNALAGPTVTKLDSGLANITVELVDAATLEVARLTTDGSLARYDFTLADIAGNPVFAHVNDYRGIDRSAVADCGNTNALPESTACTRWQWAKGNHSMSWYNDTAFAGWVNLTFPALEAGNYSLRVLATDQAGRTSVKEYMKDTKYVVAPAVKLVADALSPRVTSENTLDVKVMASQRYVAPPQEIAGDCSTQTPAGKFCPVDRVIIWLSNDRAARVKYLELTRGRTPVDDDDAAGLYMPTTDAERSLSPLTGRFNGTLPYSTSAGIVRYLSYGTTQTLPQISGVNPASALWVQAEAISTKADGTGLVSRTTDWVQVATSNQPSIQIVQPVVDWQLNVTSLGNADRSGRQEHPPFNVSFDRKTDPTAPFMRYWINTTSGTVMVTSPDGLTPNNNPGNQAPRYHFNWTGELKYLSNGTKLPQGTYTFEAQVYEGAVTIASARRHFIIMDEKPSITVPTGQNNFGLLTKPNGDRIVARQFVLNFTVDHGPVNLSLNQLDFTLDPEVGSDLKPGTGENDFKVVVSPVTPIEESAMQTKFSANITLPGGATLPNNATFKLNITAKTDIQPNRLGNISQYVDLVYDKVGPAGDLDVNVSRASVTNIFSTNPRTAASPKVPTFAGYARDVASGLRDVEVRLTDLTLNQSIVWDGSSPEREDGVGKSTWVPGTWTSGLVKLAPLNQGNFTWTLDVSSAYSNDEPDSGSRYRFNLSHVYQVDVRYRDNLSQRTETSTQFVFDSYAPELAFGSRLGGVALGAPSGIAASEVIIPWRAMESDAKMTVYATDNHCLAEVRLWSQAEGAQTANSWPMEATSGGRRVCPGGQTVKYELDLEEAPNLTETLGNVTFWFTATDHAGNTEAIPQDFRTLVVRVVDATPATATNISFDPPRGQSGGRTLIRATILEAAQMDRVEIKVFDANASGAPLKSGTMRFLNQTGSTQIWEADTTSDLSLDLAVRDYRVMVTPFDVNWNRSAEEGGPTCEDLVCPSLSRTYLVRDDGEPTVSLESPLANNVTVNATPTIRFRALHRLMETTSIVVKATFDGNESNLTVVDPANLSFTELLSGNNSRQGYSVAFKTATPLADNTTLILNVSASAAGLVSAGTYRFLVDAVGPVVTANATNTRAIGDRAFATVNTRVAITANDSVSAPSIFYKVGAGEPQTYTSALTPSGPDGVWALEYWAVDAAGNVGERKSLTLHLDTAGPRITVMRHGDDIVLDVRDNGSGLNESSITAFYRYGDSPSFSSKLAEKVAGDSFSVTLPGNASQQGLRYYFTALDQLGQAGSVYSAASPYLIGVDNQTPSNLPPTVRITAPIQGATVTGDFELKWLAQDPEGAPLTISIALRDPAPGRVLSAAGENSGAFRVNLTGLTGGSYTLVVTASDGENSASATVGFTLEGADVIVPEDVPTGNVAANTPQRIAVNIESAGKTVAQATYRIIKDGQLAGQGILTASNGTYAAGFTPTAPGRYAILVEVAYTDGSTETPKQVSQFTVPGTSSPPETAARPAFPVSLMALAAIAVLTIALAAYGAFGRWKK